VAATFSKARLGRLRLAAQRLTPETAAPDPLAATRAVIGIQAQEIRAAGLAIRSRAPGLIRADVEGAGLVRTWTVRGTVHLHAREDLPWLLALTGPRNRRYFDGLMAKRGNLERAHSLLGEAAAIAADGPITRTALLERLAERGLPSLGEHSVNIATPWFAAHGALVGLADGRFQAADPLPPIDEEEALATLGRRYLEGYGPAGPADLAKWSGLPLGQARPALDSVEGTVRVGDLVALSGTLDEEPPRAPPALLLAAFDTSMLGWRTREPLVASADDYRVLPGGGVIRPVVLARGTASGTWRLTGSGARRKLDLDAFRRPPAAAALRAEANDVGRFLGLEVKPAA